MGETGGVRAARMVLSVDILEHVLGIRGQIRIRDLAIRERWGVTSNGFKAPTLDLLLEGPDLPETREGCYPEEIVLIHEGAVTYKGFTILR